MYAFNRCFLNTEYVPLCPVLELFPTVSGIESAGDVDKETGHEIHIRRPGQKLSTGLRGGPINSVLAWSSGCQEDKAFQRKLYLR